MTGVALTVFSVRYIPSWMPGGGFKRDVAYWKPFVVEMYERPFKHMQKAIVSLHASSIGVVGLPIMVFCRPKELQYRASSTRF